MKHSKEQLNAGTPVIVLTANAVVGAKEKYLSEGFTNYLSKPVREEKLMEMLRRYLPQELVEDNKNTEPAQDAVPQTTIEEVPQTLEQRFPSLNIALGMDYCMNSEAFFLEMIETYIRGDRREELEKAYAQEEWKSYETHIHALKSTSLNIGAEKLSEHAKALEFAARDGDSQYIHEHHDEVMAEYGELLTQLSRP